MPFVVCVHQTDAVVPKNVGVFLRLELHQAVGKRSSGVMDPRTEVYSWLHVCEWTVWGISKDTDETEQGSNLRRPLQSCETQTIPGNSHALEPRARVRARQTDRGNVCPHPYEQS